MCGFLSRRRRRSRSIEPNQRVAVPLTTILRDHSGGAHPGVARDRRLLRAFLHRDCLRARLRRPGARDLARALSCIAVRGRLSSWRSPLRSPRRSRTVLAGGRCCSFPPSSPSRSDWRCPLCSRCGERVGVFAFLALALGAMGLTFAPLGALLPELFPVPVRYTGAASAYNLGGILGASFAPSLAQDLRGAWRRRLGGLLYRRRGRDQLPGSVQHAARRWTRRFRRAGTCPQAPILLTAAPSRTTWENARSPAGVDVRTTTLQPGVSL